MSEDLPLNPQMQAISGAAFEAASERLRHALHRLDVQSVSVNAAIERVRSGPSLTDIGLNTDMADLVEALEIARERELELTQAAAQASDALGGLIEEVREALQALPQ